MTTRSKQVKSRKIIEGRIMSHTLTVSDKLYKQLSKTTKVLGLDNIENLLEMWQEREDELRRRRKVVQQIDKVRKQLLTKYGEMPNSVELIQEDRMR